MPIIRHRPEEHTGALVRPREWWEPLEVMRDMLSWDPFEEMRQITGLHNLAFVPSFDVKESKDAYLFTADLPGVKEDDLEVTVSGHRLTVSGKRDEEKKTEEERYYAYERRYGSFSRSFTLPEEAEPGSISAVLKNGELSIRVPKKAEHQPKRIPLSKAA
jgi:HSP20 family protein